MSELETANRRLLALQAESRQRRGEVQKDLIDQVDNNATAVSGTPVLPSHLGWHSAAVTRVIERHHDIVNVELAPSIEWPPHKPEETSLHIPLPSSFKVFPDIASKILKNNLTAPARVWLILKYIDANRGGSGCLILNDIQAILTDTASPWRICGSRQMRNLITQGDGVFWSRDDDRLWLRAVAKVARSLQINRLTGYPVSVPTSVVLGSVADLRAHMYAVFHTGRRRSDMPIARDTITEITGVDKRTQRSYEKRTRMGVRENFCIGECVTSSTAEDQAWQQKGKGCFVLSDVHGEHGLPGKMYLAWQLPNSYNSGQHHRLPKGSLRRINRQLQSLLHQGTAGNGISQERRSYYPDGKSAALAFGRDNKDSYWRKPGKEKKSRWHILGKY